MRRGWFSAAAGAGAAMNEVPSNIAATRVTLNIISLPALGAKQTALGRSVDPDRVEATDNAARLCAIPDAFPMARGRPAAPRYQNTEDIVPRCSARRRIAVHRLPLVRGR
jgi:hypothetical protein